MTVVLAAASPDPLDNPDLWPEDGTRLVVQSRHSAPGLDALLTWAYHLGASCVDFSTGERISIRLHGRNRWVSRYTLNELELGQIANHLYGSDGMARLSGGQGFDLAYPIVVTRTERLRFRVNATATLSTRGAAANLVLRPIPHLPRSLAEQSVEDPILAAYRPQNGMVIVSGPVGSGKSTLIAGMSVEKLLDPDGHFRIHEGAAPVEFMLDQIKSPSSVIRHSEIPRNVLTFDEFIRACTRREGTDIIVGECRDGPTMAAAVNAAMAGWALTTTIHANNVSLTLQRAVSLLPVAERENLVTALGQALRLIINQMLVPATDGTRTALREFLVFDRPLRTRLLRADPASWPSMIEDAVAEQGQSYATAARVAVEQGRITEQTAQRVLREIG